MFKLALIASLVALSVAQYGHGGYGGDGGYGQELHAPIPYKYGFDIAGGDHHTIFKQTREEQGDGHGNVQGSYSYTDAHGNQRVVNYVADHDGFRADVKTNEPGTESQSPADVHLQSSAPRDHGASLGGGYGGSYGHGSVYGGNGLY